MRVTGLDKRQKDLKQKFSTLFPCFVFGRRFCCRYLTLAPSPPSKRPVTFVSALPPYFLSTSSALIHCLLFPQHSHHSALQEWLRRSSMLSASVVCPASTLPGLNAKLKSRVLHRLPSSRSRPVSKRRCSSTTNILPTWVVVFQHPHHPTPQQPHKQLNRVPNKNSLLASTSSCSLTAEPEATAQQNKDQLLALVQARPFLQLTFPKLLQPP